MSLVQKMATRIFRHSQTGPALARARAIFGLAPSVQHPIRPAATRGVQIASVMQTALFAAHMCRLGKLLDKSLVGTGLALEYLGLPRLAQVHDARVFELVDQSFFSSGGHG